MAYPPSTTTRTATLSESQYNADISGLAAAMVPANINDYSNDVTEMQTVTSPGAVGTESLADSLAGEIARIRYQLKAITGEAQWYSAPSISLAGVSSGFASGTYMVFHQSTAPTGWTKETNANWNDATLRTVTGTVNVPTSTNPGRSGFLATVMAQTTVGNHTLTTAQMPTHTHTVAIASTGGGVTPEASGAGSGSTTKGSAGSSSSHNHTLTMDIKYVDVIVASKN